MLYMKQQRLSFSSVPPVVTSTTYVDEKVDSKSDDEGLKLNHQPWKTTLKYYSGKCGTVVNFFFSLSLK